MENSGCGIRIKGGCSLEPLRRIAFALFTNLDESRDTRHDIYASWHALDTTGRCSMTKTRAYSSPSSSSSMMAVSIVKRTRPTRVYDHTRHPIKVVEMTPVTSKTMLRTV